MIAIYKKFLETCISISSNLFDLEPADAILHFDSDTVKNQSESFKLMQFYMIVYACNKNNNFFFNLKSKSNIYLLFFLKGDISLTYAAWIPHSTTYSFHVIRIYLFLFL